ncbi:flagellar basal body rod protein FlgC [Halobacillus salinarum]|uniref:Flagellar basal-body rod protein FlgC n=1 Tax=Halobacillus salinarum TaxID=2932257 RepID=A0ABY4EF16_9BACI|nr:flagellar basal body rod protein FlgC [Halobacillus salinarum]UOQ43058.1 flagellar basal body rod protein FlgC [Halobacillus salinarum]
MGIFHSLNTSASALTAQRLRMDVASSNIANADSTRATRTEDGNWEPYRRKTVVFKPKEESFQSFLQKAANSQSSSSGGVEAVKITEDDEPFKMVYNPNHPDSDQNGYVKLPNVDPLQEMVDIMGATRSYEANVTSINASKNMLMKALEIGR